MKLAISRLAISPQTSVGLVAKSNGPGCNPNCWNPASMIAAVAEVGILLFATLGTIGANPSTFELGMLLAFGVLGYAMRLFGYPIAPIVVGLILGPMAEQQLRRALSISQGDWGYMVQSPIAAVLLGIAALALIVPLILRARGKGEMLSQLAGDED